MVMRGLLHASGAFVAKKASQKGGQSKLDQAITLLINNQAAFVQQLAESNRDRAEMQRQHLEYQRESAARFARIQVHLAEIIRLLNEHSRILERLPEAIRAKIGSKSPR
jgi:Mg2+ and Co2+ transporter CorA